MSKSSSTHGLSLVMPVHNGGVLFEDALRSVKPVLHLFDLVVISVNSGTRNHEEVSTIEKVLGSQSPNLFIIVQEQILPPTIHNLSIVQNSAFQKYEPTHKIMFLYHDDLLMFQNLEKSITGLQKGDKSVLIGDWVVSKTRSVIDPHVSAIGDQVNMGPTEWIASMGFGHRFTNASGMIVPFSVWRDVAEYMSKSRYGARYEYLLSTHRGVQSLVRSSLPLVMIYEHGNQEGANVPLMEYHFDEIRYIRWLWLQRRLNKPVISSIFLVKICFSVFMYLSLSAQKLLFPKSRSG